DGDFVAQRHEIVGDGQRSRPGADAGEALTVLAGRRLGQKLAYVIAMIGGDALQAADGDWLIVGRSFDAAAPTRGLARTIAHPAENAREHIGFAIDEIRRRELALRDQADVFRNVGVGRAGPLAIDDAMII